MNELRYIVASRTQPALVAEGRSGGFVRVWEVSTVQLLAGFATNFAGILGRIALCEGPLGAVVVTSAWAGDGVTAYDAASGRVLWSRQYQDEAYLVSPAGLRSSVAVGFERASMQILDIGTGGSKAELRGVRTYRQSQYDPIGVAQYDGKVALVHPELWRRGVTLPISGFAMLEAAFAPDTVLVSDSTDPATANASVMAWDVQGRAKWRYEVERDTNVPWLSWHTASQSWLGIARHVDRRVPDVLLRWSANGELLDQRPLDGHREYAFAAEGTALIADDSINDPLSLAPIGRLSGPHRD